MLFSPGSKSILEREIIIVLLLVVALEISVLLNFVHLKYGMHFIARLVLSALAKGNPEAFFYVFALFLLWLYNFNSNDYTVAFDWVVIATSITIILTGNCIGLLMRTVTDRAWSIFHDLVVLVTVLLLAGVITVVTEKAIVFLIPSMAIAFLTSTLRLSLNYCVKMTDSILLSAYALYFGLYLLLSFAAGNVLLENYENLFYYLDSTLLSVCISYYYGMDFSDSAMKYILHIINPDSNTFAHIKFTYTGDGHYCTRRDYGLEIDFPPTSHIKRGIDVTVKVRETDDGFQIPNGLELVSAIYSISTSRPLPVEAELRIQHCVPGHMVASGRLIFVCAHNGPPYEFQQIDGGVFSQDSSYGVIKVSEFSDFGIAWLLQGWRQPHAPTNLVVGMYSYGTTASFVVTRNLAVHLRAVEGAQNGRTVKSTIVAIDGNFKEIKLALPVKRKGWGITSTFNPAVITLEAIRDFQPGKAIPKISLEMEWLHLSEPVKPTDVKVKVLGLKNLINFKLPCGRKCVMPISNQHNSSDDEIQTASSLTVIIRYLKQHPQRLDKDFLLVRQLLPNLNKEQLKHIGIRLGLAHDTVNNYYESSVDKYCCEMLRAWISERDNVIDRGGATWQNLKKALQAEGLSRHAEKMEVEYKERLYSLEILELKVEMNTKETREERMMQEMAEERQKCAELQLKLAEERQKNPKTQTELSEQKTPKKVNHDEDTENGQHLHVQEERRGKLELLSKFFGLVSLFVDTTGNMMVNYFYVLVLWIKPENLLMYMALVVFAFHISPKELFKFDITTVVFVGSLFGIYILVGVVNKRTNLRAKTWLVTLTVFCIIMSGHIFLLSEIENPYCTSVLGIPLAILIGIRHVSFKTYWYCILAVCCATHFLILTLLYSIGMLQFTLIVELRAALVTCLIESFILQYVQDKFSQDVIEVKNYTYVGSELSFLWSDYGIELHIPATSDLIDDIDVMVKVRAPGESFQIPNGLELVSAIYNISTSRPLPVEAELRIQHCVPGHMVASGRLTFVSARNGPPYEFQQIDGGLFSKYSSYGVIKVSEFSEFGIAWLLQGWRQPHAPTNLVVGMYSYGTTASFVVTRNLAVHLRAVEGAQNGRTDKSTIVAIDGNFKEIKLALPVKRKGWRITSTFNPAVITLEAIRDFQPGKAIPRISLEMEWLHLSEPVKPTDVKVKVLGLKNLIDFNLPCGRSCVTQISNQHSSSDDEIQTASCLTAIFRYLKPNILHPPRCARLNLDKDFLFVRHLLSGLNKEKLKYVGMRLGLAHDTVNNFYDSSVAIYCSEILTAWINERDNVIDRGGATWQNLKKALQDEGLNGHAEKILY